jgi:hypothetical protein
VLRKNKKGVWKMSPRVPVLQPYHSFCLFLLMLLLIVRTAAAVPIGPGETVSLPGTNLTDRPELGGTVAVTATVPFVGPNNSYDGTIEVSVVEGSDFSAPVEQYRILSFNASANEFKIVGLDSSSQVAMNIMPLDVDYFDDTPGDRAPSTASLPPGEGIDEFVWASVRFEFSNPVMPNETSRTMFVVPNADITIPILGEYGAGILVRDAAGGDDAIRFTGCPLNASSPDILWSPTASRRSRSRR